MTVYHRGRTLFFTVAFILFSSHVAIAGKDNKETPSPTKNPTRNPTPVPTFELVPAPSAAPTPEPTVEIDDSTAEPTPEPTEDATPQPTPDTTAEPTLNPTRNPTRIPTAEPTSSPPTTQPTVQEPNEPETTEPKTFSPTTKTPSVATSAPSKSPIAPPPNLKEVPLPQLEIDMIMSEEEALSLPTMVVDDALSQVLDQAMGVDSDFANFQFVDVEVTGVDVLDLGRIGGRVLQTGKIVRVNADASGTAFFKEKPAPTEEAMAKFLKTYFKEQGNVLLEFRLTESVSSVSNTHVSVNGEDTLQTDGSTSQEDPPSDGGSSNSVSPGLIVLLVVAVVGFIFSVTLFVYFQRKRSKKKNEESDGLPDYYATARPLGIEQPTKKKTKKKSEEKILAMDDDFSLSDSLSGSVSSLYTSDTNPSYMPKISGMYDVSRLDKVLDISRTPTKASES